MAKETKTPPAIGQNGAKVPPPISNKKPLTGSNNQYPSRNPGVKNRTPVYEEPILKHITLEDLRDPARLDTLYRQACGEPAAALAVQQIAVVCSGRACPC